MDDKVEVKCPHCGYRNQVDEGWMGRPVKCPKCRRGFIASDSTSDLGERLSTRVPTLLGSVGRASDKVPWNHVGRVVVSLFAISVVFLVIVFVVASLSPRQQEGAVVIGLVALGALILIWAMREIACWWIKTTALLETENEILEVLKDIRSALSEGNGQTH